MKVYRLSGKQLTYNSKAAGDRFYETEKGLILQIKQSVPITGDIVVEIKDSKAIGTNLLISYVFNTAFIVKK